MESTMAFIWQSACIQWWLVLSTSRMKPAMILQSHLNSGIDYNNGSTKFADYGY
jgi:hypothetical protein